MKRLVLIIVLFFAFFTNANAAHFLGGEITWECHPTTGKYRFIVHLYRECGGQSVLLPNSVTLSGGPLVIICPQIQINEISPDCGSINGGIYCGMPNASKGAAERVVYRSSWITLNGVPPIAGWDFSFGSCCLSSGIDNLFDASVLYNSTMYSYKNKNANTCYDNSPNFLEHPLVASCSGTTITYNNFCVDKDSDSLFYRFTPALTSSHVPATYLNGYSYSSPFPSNTPPFNTNNKSITLNGKTGQINFTTFDNGGYVSVVRAEEWRDGVKIGEVNRFITTFIYSCVPDTGACSFASNTAPSLHLIVDSASNPNGPWVKPNYDLNGTLVNYETTVYAKDKIRFTIQSIDADTLPNCSAQSIAFSASGGNLSSDSLWSDSSICNYNAPCATLTSLNIGGGFVNDSSNVVAFKWDTDCPHLTYQQFAKTPKSVSYDFNFKMSDNNCPIPESNFVVYKVNVLNPQPTPPILQSCVDLVALSGDLSFNWTTPLDTNINFDYYVVYHSVSKTGPFTALDTLANYTDTTFVDSARGSGTNYYFVRTAGGCSILSETSDTISLMHLMVTPQPQTNPTQAVLNWNAHSSNPSGIYYQIWKRVLPAGTWSQIDSTQNLTYTDNLNGASFTNLEYQVGINGNCLSSMVYIGIDERILEYVSVSPNPFNDKIILTLPTEINSNALTIKLFGVGGVELKGFEITIRDSEIIISNLDGLPHGVYLLQINVSNGMKTIKLLH